MNLLQRYQEICLTVGIRPHPSVEDSLAAGTKQRFLCISVLASHQPLVDDDLKPIALLVKETKDKSFRLRFPNQKITDKGASIIASIFQVSGNLESVLLPFNEIRDEGAGAFGASLSTSKSLPSVLDLTGNPISDKGMSLLFRGFCLREIPARANSLHLRVGETNATDASGETIISALLTGMFASLVVTRVTEDIRLASFDVGTNLIECDLALLNAKVVDLEQACAFPATHDAKMKRLAARISELEKKLSDSEDREKQCLKRVSFLEENVAREQEQCAKLLRQCQKLVNSIN
jgi:hypothetical protein